MLTILDLVFSTQPDLISEVETIPGISDHEAIIFTIRNIVHIQKKQPHKVYLYHKCNLDAIKVGILKFQQSFVQSDPYARTVDNNWTLFKSFILDLLHKHVPQKTCKSHKDLPWINTSIKREIRHRKHLYNRAKQSNLSTDWGAYRESRNKVTSMLDQAHSMYQSCLFDESFSGNRKQFWKYVRSLRKESFGIPTLLHNNKEFNTSEDKANVLNTYFQSVFTDEDLSNIPTLGTNTYPFISSITFSTQGIETILANLDPNKTSGPDNLHPYILKHCAHVIAPILKIIFTQSISSGSLPTDWLTANITPILKKVITVLH